MALRYGITSSSQMIDVEAIKQACVQIETAAADFTTASKKVEDAKSYCGKGALEVEGKTMEESFDQVSGDLSNVEKSIKDFTSSIVSTAQSIYYAQSQELAEYQQQLAQQQQNQ